jgi:mannose-6-phosphate isomerase-like protein (cupin superfamily)
MSLPGGIGVTHLRVYPDGGTPHLHTLCTEAYAIAGGRGSVQTLTLGDGYVETPLEAGMVVSFPPGTIHRLMNEGDLEIFVLMANAGLPEAGDMVITFEPSVLGDRARYAEAAAVPVDDAGVARRRDRAVEGFLRIRAGGEAALRAFHDACAQLVEPHLDDWRTIWSDGPLAAATATGEQLDALAMLDHSHFDTATISAKALAAERRFGCCGTLGTHVAR